jgi:DnaJ family protein C protein 3
MVKSLDKGFTKLEELLNREDWRAVVKLLMTTGSGKNGDLWRRWEEAMLENVEHGKDIQHQQHQFLARRNLKNHSYPSLSLPKYHLSDKS